MWWMFEKESENKRYVQYRYSVDSFDLDGIIQYDKEKRDIIILKESKLDQNKERAKERTKTKFYNVVLEGFPEKRQVACG